MTRAALLALFVLIAPQVAQAQSCPAPLADASRLVLVTADGFSTSTARLQLYERDAADGPWRARGDAGARDRRFSLLQTFIDRKSVV